MLEKLHVKISFMGCSRMDEEVANFAKGFLWGVALSIPLWVSTIGWVKIILHIYDP
jgi:hypothetical protein